MTLLKELGTVNATRSLVIHLGVLFFVLFPVGIVVLLITKYLVTVLFHQLDATEPIDGFFWLFSPDRDDRLQWQMETSTLMNCTAAFVALVVFMIRALLKMGELPSLINGIITLHVRLGFRMVALPLLTVLVCALTSFAIYFVFSGVDDFADTYATLSMIVLLPTAIGTWIWVWKGDWITSIPPLAAPPPESNRRNTETLSDESV